jgi:hypothetical protein
LPNILQEGYFPEIGTIDDRKEYHSTYLRYASQSFVGASPFLFSNNPVNSYGFPNVPRVFVYTLMNERNNRKRTGTIRDLYDAIDPDKGDAVYFWNAFSVHTKKFT